MDGCAEYRGLPFRLQHQADLAELLRAKLEKMRLTSFNDLQLSQSKFSSDSSTDDPSISIDWHFFHPNLAGPGQTLGTEIWDLPAKQML